MLNGGNLKRYLAYAFGEILLIMIGVLIKDIQRNPHSGTGKPEPLKYDLAGCWSRRIDQEHRLVYQAVDKLSDDLAVKLKNTGVRINTLDPGWLRTDLGGEHADHPVEAVLPGALAPALIEDDGPNGQFFSAIDHDLDIKI